MCGRFTRHSPIGTILEAFDARGIAGEAAGGIDPSYNVAPTQQVLAVLVEEGERRVALLRWGLIPSWAKDPSIGSKTINARGETVAEKPTFRAAFRHRRCLIVADGFFEWRREAGGNKTPLYIRLKGGAPMAFAGLWERWAPPEGAAVRSCTIITTEANATMRAIHDRMPVILPPEAWDLWLDPKMTDPAVLKPLLRAIADDALETHPVSKAVNSPGNNSATLILPMFEE